MEYKTIPIDLIDPHPENPRQHPDEQLTGLEASYKELGQFRSFVVWQRPDGRYIQVTSHGITEAMKREGAKEVRVEVLSQDTDPLRVKQIMLADNLHAQKSHDDETLLAQLLQEQQDLDFPLEALGSSDESLRQMLEQLGDVYLGEDERDETEDVLPETVETRAKVGDVWQLGRHRIACIDSCDPEQVKRFIGDATISFVWADPPYGISIVATNGSVGGGEAYDIPFGGVKTKRLGTSNGSKPFGSKLDRGSIGGANPPGSKNNLKIAPNIKAGKYAPVIGDNSTITAVSVYCLCTEIFPKAIQIWWGANNYAHALPSSTCWIVWDKENTGNFADAELAWCSDNSAVRIFRHMWNGLMKDSEKGQRRVHPTQKPVALAEWSFEKYGKEQDIIFDPFLGSGMSIIAAENLNRTVYGCELSPEYIDVIATRWEQHTGQSAQLIERVEEGMHV